MDDHRSPNTTEDMLAELGLSGVQTERLRELLVEVADLAHEVPEPSEDVRALLSGAIPLRSRRRAAIVAAAAGALALGGVSAAAAANRLPSPVQEVVADATGGVVPHPVKPTNPPFDAPGHVANKPKTTPSPKPDATPTPLNTTAPGQIQKSTKPEPTAPGPAHPADPGSHGRAHNTTNVNGDGNAKADTDDDAGDNDDAGRKPDKGKSD